MPCSCENEKLCETKPCKSHKSSKALPACKTDCCNEIPELDCCSAAYQRLDKLRVQWLDTTLGDYQDIETSNGVIINPTTSQPLTDGNGIAIKLPVAALFSTDNITTLQYAIPLVGAPGESTGVFTAPILDNAYASYFFTNALRYSYVLECGKPDQIYGWLFDTQTENLEVFTNISEYGLTPAITRAALLAQGECSLTRQNKIQLAGLNNLYKISIKALGQVQYQSPRREGNIVQVCDKTGQKWLVAINRASSLNVPSVGAGYSITQFTIVATPVC